MQPWAHIDTGVRIEFLVSECEHNLRGEATLDCRVRCLNCGILATFKDPMPELSCIADFAQATSVHTPDDN